LADSALAVPRAAFGDHEAFPTLIEKAAILVERLTRNHPLPDGNKRCAFLALERFLAANGRPILNADPDTDAPMMERIAPETPIKTTLFPGSSNDQPRPTEFATGQLVQLDRSGFLSQPAPSRG
jgi:prophage maintenance system killer protein